MKLTGSRPAWHRLLHRRGAASLEFALILPILTLIMIATADLGNAIQQSIRLETAARAGAQFALAYPGQSTCASVTDATCIQGQVRTALNGWTDITVGTPTLRCVCPGNTGVDCSNEATCSTWTEQYLTITVSRPHVPLLFTPFPTIEGRAEVRLR